MITPEAGNNALVLLVYFGLLWHEVQQIEKMIDYEYWETNGKAPSHALTATRGIERL